MLLKVPFLYVILLCFISFDAYSIDAFNSQSNTNTISSLRKDTFISKYISPLKVTEIQLGDFQKGDAIVLQFKEVKGGKLKETELLLGERILYSKSNIKKKLPEERILISEDGILKLVVNNKYKLLRRRLTIAVKHLKAPSQKPFVPEIDLAFLIANEEKDTTLKDTILHQMKLTLSRNKHGQIQEVVATPTSNTDTINVARIESKRVLPFQQLSFNLGVFAAADRVLIDVWSDKTKRKLSELSLTNDGTLSYLKGKIKPDSILIASAIKEDANLVLQISNKGAVLPRRIYVTANKINTHQKQYFKRDTTGFYDCQATGYKDTIVENSRHAIHLNNALDFEQAHRTHLKLTIPAYMHNVDSAKVEKYYAQITPASMMIPQNPITDIQEVDDTYPALIDYFCYTFSKNELDKNRFFSSEKNCEKKENFYFTSFDFSEGKKDQTIHFFAQNLNQSLELNAVLKIFLSYKVKYETMTQCPKIQFVKSNLVLP